MTTREYHREWARKNSKRRQELNKRWKDKRAQAFKEYKESLSCNRCGFSHPAALVFHHKDPETKEVAVGVAVRQWSFAKLLTEIEKCEVLCANCHSIEHFS